MFYYQFNNTLIFEAKGADVERYLNARLTNDITKLKILSSCEAAALNAQGKTQVFALVVRLEQEKIHIICDAGDAESAGAALSQFIVADRVEIKPLPRLSFFHFSDSNKFAEIYGINPLSEGETIALNDGYAVGRNRIGGIGIDLILYPDKQNQFENIHELEAEQWHAECIAAGKASYPKEINSAYLFSEAGLSSAISFTKGCYVGQEVMEKIDAFAKTPYVLRSLFLDGRTQLTDAAGVDDEAGKKVGSLVSSAYSKEEDKTYIFARIKNKDENLTKNLFIESKKLVWTKGQQN